MTALPPTLAALPATVASETMPFAPIATVVGVHVVVRPEKTRKHREAGLLGVVEALIKRRAGIGDLLERGARLAHVIGPTRHPIEWSGGSLRLRLLVSRLAGLHTLDPQLDHIAQGSLECRPVLRLVRREFESRLKRCDPRVSECGNVVSTEPVMLFGAGTAVTETTMVAGTLLRVDKRRAGDSKQRCRGNYGLEHVILQDFNVRK
jgi:hypothetical protein